MTFSRREVLAGGATVGLVLTAGCLDFVRGDGPLEFDAERVAPSDSALDATEYEEQSVDSEMIEETIDVGVEREVRASFWVSTYTKDVEFQGEQREAGLFAAVSLPAMSVLGQSFNPLDELSSEELLEEFLSEADGEYDAVGDLDLEESFALEILGDDRLCEVFVGETEIDGEPIEITISLSSFEHEDDLIVLLGSYPDLLADEGPNIEELMESVEHPV